MQRVLRSDLGIDRLQALPEEHRGDLPLDVRVHAGRPPRDHENEGLPVRESTWAPTIAAIGRAYREGRTTPTEVVTRALAEARRLATLGHGPMQDFNDEAALAEAAEATERIRSQRAIGPLDGVPWVVKEQTFVKGLPTRSGTSFRDASPQPKDATAVARVREGGAIAIGTTVMTEYGMTPSGANPHRAMPHNPHAKGHLAGGSSTGTGVAVATGLVPFGLGADGGGSIRIPSAINGVFGIKPTWGRISRAGDSSGGSVAHLGPLGSSTSDLAHALEHLSGPDHNDPQTFAAPHREAGSFVAALSRGVRGMVIGIPDTEWADADASVAKAGREALAALEREGAKLVKIELPTAKYASSIGVITIACEARALLRVDWQDHANEMGHDVQVSFAVLDAFSAMEFLDSQRLRNGLRREMAHAYQEVDLVALPSVVGPAAKVSETDMRTGFLDTKVIDGLCRFAFLGNLTGLPGLSAPVGVDGLGLPLGLQLMSDAWDEATAFAASAHLERIGAAVPRRPKASASIL